MKKRMLLTLLTLALVITCAVFSVSAAGTDDSVRDSFVCPCTACAADPDSIVWNEVNSANVDTLLDAPASGHYYIGSDVTLTKDLSVGSNEVVILVDGCTFTVGSGLASTTRPISCVNAGAKLYLVGNNNATLSVHTANLDGGMVQMGGVNTGANKVNPELHFYGSLTVQRNANAAHTPKDGGLFKIFHGTVRIHGCANMGLDTTTDPILYGTPLATTSNYGGIALVNNSNGSFIMDAGTLHGSSDHGGGGAIYQSGGTVTVNDGIINGASTAVSRGGAIYQTGGTLYIVDGTITGGQATRGGNIYSNSTVNISGGTITEGNAATAGGNIFISAGTVTFTGGTVSEGATDNFGGNIYLYNGTLRITDTDAKTVISGGSAVTGGNIFVNNGKENDVAKQGICSVNLTKALSGISGGSATTGGNIYSAYSFTLTAGTISGGIATENGGDIYVNSGTTNINGGTVSGGTAANGGNIYHKGGLLNLRSGNIIAKTVGTNENGTVTKGCAIYVAGGTLKMGEDVVNYTAPVVTGAKTAPGGNGGTMYIAGGAVTLFNGTVNGGTAADSLNADGKHIAGGMGGAIYAESSLTVNNVAVVGGTAWRGGSVYVDKGTYTMNGGSISGGNASNQGAQVFLAGTFNMTSGTVTANPKNSGGAAGFRVQDGKLNLSGSAVVITAGTEYTDGIDVVSTSASKLAEVTLAGSATVKNQSGTTDGNNVINMQNYQGNRVKLTVKKDWSGAAGLTLNYLIGSNKNEDAQYQVGLVLDADYAAAEGEFSGTLTLLTAPQQPPLIYHESGALQCCPFQLCTYNLPALTARWFKSATEAAEAAKEGDYINLCASGLTMNIGDKDVLVDFNGNDCTVTGTGKLYMMDAAGDGFGAELAKVTYNNVAISAMNPANDRQYVALSNGDGTYSAHRIDLRISAVSIRPGSAGIYYTAELNCDDTLKAAFQTAGVAVSLDAVPGYDYTTKSLYTQIDTLTKPEFTGVLINEILKNGENNDQRGNTTVYANAYATFAVDGQTVTILADPYNTGKTKDAFLPGHNYTAYSLNDVMQALDLRWRKLDDASRQRVLDQLYNAYDGVMQDWNLRFIDSHVTGEPVKSLKVLMIGNSLSVDAGHMLGYICKIEGMESVRISTLYYGGCTQQQHATFLTNNTPEYRWYDTNITDLQNTDIADVVPEVSLAKADQITMYEGIVMDDWDIIVTQQGVWQAGMPETHEEDLDTVINYVRKHATNPNAILMWNMNWAPPVEADMLAKANNGIPPDASGFESSYKSMTGFDVVVNNKEAQDKMFELIRNAVQTKILTNDNFIDVIPAATAQQNALWSGMKDSDMYRDYIHASDLSRYIYSYLWFCKLTDADFDGVASDVVPLAVRYIKADDISEIPAATEDLDLTENDNYLLNIVNHCISSALENPFTPKGINN